MLTAGILGTATVLRGRLRGTAEVGAEAMPDRPAAVLRRLTGIETRYWLDAETTVAALACEALRGALDRARLAPEALERVILVTSTGGDTLVPASVNAVIAGLGLDGRADGFDLNNACTGFLSAFDVAARCVATGSGPIGIAVVETLTRFLSPAHPRPYMVFGDAAMAAVVGPAASGGVHATHFGNVGAHRGAVVLGHPGWAGTLTCFEFESSRDELLDLARGALQKSADRVLAAAGLRLDEVEWVVLHQPNGSMLQALIRGLGIDPARVVPVVEAIGSVGAASVAVSLDRLLRERPVAPGDRILMMAVGAGMSYGAVLYEVGR